MRNSYDYMLRMWILSDGGGVAASTQAALQPCRCVPYLHDHGSSSTGLFQDKVMQTPFLPCDWLGSIKALRDFKVLKAHICLQGMSFCRLGDCLSNEGEGVQSNLLWERSYAWQSHLLCQLGQGGCLQGCAPFFSTEPCKAVLVERACSWTALSIFNLLSLYITSDMLDFKKPVLFWGNNSLSILIYTAQAYICSRSFVMKIKSILP